MSVQAEYGSSHIHASEPKSHAQPAHDWLKYLRGNVSMNVSAMVALYANQERNGAKKPFAQHWY